MTAPNTDAGTWNDAQLRLWRRHGETLPRDVIRFARRERAVPIAQILTGAETNGAPLGGGAGRCGSLG
jgi:hypothetical protein